MVDDPLGGYQAQKAITAVAAVVAVPRCAVQARRWVKEAVESGKYKPRLVMPVAAAAV